jgi:hypothetical protein
VREVNRITKWSTKSTFQLKFVTYFLPHLKDILLRKKQKKVVKKIRMYIQNKNPIWRLEKGIVLDFWMNERRNLGQLIVRSRSEYESKLTPF